MPKQELLPGVSTRACPPQVVCDAHDTIRRARRRAWLRDGLQLALLIGVDWLFVYWPESRMPFVSRAESLMFLRGMNAVIIGQLWLTHALPKWTARRIAGTWTSAERSRFLGSVRRK